MPTAYNEGSVVRFQATFKDAAGVLADPGAVVLKVRDPLDVVTTYTYALGQVSRASVGVFFRDTTISKEGQWEFWFTGSGGLIAAGGDEITALPARVE